MHRSKLYKMQVRLKIAQRWCILDRAVINRTYNYFPNANIKLKIRRAIDENGEHHFRA